MVDTFTHHFCVNGHGWVIEYINPPMGRVVNTHPLRSSSLVHTHINLYSQSLLLTTKVRHISCMLCFMLHNTAWYRSFMQELGYEVSSPIPMHCDNKGTVDLALNPVTGRLSKHILFFFNDTATTEIYTLSLHDALPI